MGCAHQGIDEPHLHRSIHEIYCVARGSAVVRVEGERVRLEQGQVLVVEPGEVHTFVSSSADYMHFVIQAPGLRGEEARADKVLLP